MEMSYNSNQLQLYPVLNCSIHFKEREGNRNDEKRRQSEENEEIHSYLD
jgi:hypothetical protein